MTAVEGIFVLERAWSDAGEPGSVHAEINLGGHHERAHVRFNDPIFDFCQLEEMGPLLSMHRPSSRVVINEMHRVYKGEARPFPMDLYPRVKNVEPEFPFHIPTPEYEARVEAACKALNVRCVSVRPSDDVPNLYEVELTVGTRALRLRATLFGGAGKAPVVIWRDCDEPESMTTLTAEERAAADWAMLHATGLATQR